VNKNRRNYLRGKVVTELQSFRMGWTESAVFFLYNIILLLY